MKRVTLEEIREISENVGELLQKFIFGNMQDGRYILENDIFVNVESYTTKKKRREKI